MEREIGSLEPGKRADLIVLAQGAPWAQPSYDVYAHIAYALKGVGRRHQHRQRARADGGRPHADPRHRCDRGPRARVPRADRRWAAAAMSAAAARSRPCRRCASCSTSAGGWRSSPAPAAASAGSIARRFAEAGARVAVHYRASRDGAEAVAGEIAAAGGEARAFAADLTQDGEAERLVEGVASAIGPLGVLVNNAGSYPLADLLQVNGGRVGHGPGREPAERARVPAGRRTPHGRARRGRDRQRHVDPGVPPGPAARPLQRGQGRARDADALRRARARALGRAGQRRGARPRLARGAGDGLAGGRRALRGEGAARTRRASRRTSPTPASSSRRPPPASSPARRSSSTAACWPPPAF